MPGKSRAFFYAQKGLSTNIAVIKNYRENALKFYKPERLILK